jgi:hypothetical protein
VTSNNRSGSRNAKDPGGRLGPYHSKLPDLRNLMLYYRPVEEGTPFICLLVTLCHWSFYSTNNGDVFFFLQIIRGKRYFNIFAHPFGQATWCSRARMACTTTPSPSFWASLRTSSWSAFTADYLFSFSSTLSRVPLVVEVQSRN